MPPKRRAARASASPKKKKAKTRSPKSPSRSPQPSDEDLTSPHPLAALAEEHGIVQRKYYPPEMSDARAQAYNDGHLPRPIETLLAALDKAQPSSSASKDGPKDKLVVHWFKTDLRTRDNRALSLASDKAAALGVPLVCVYLASPQDWEAHLMAPVRVDFVLRTLKVLQDDLAKLDIPLYMETVERRRDVPSRMLELLEAWGARHLFANMEYEVDELRREAKMVGLCKDKGIGFQVVHDTCVVPPGSLQTGTGKQYAVFTPWLRAWCAHLHENPHLLEPFEAPAANPSGVRSEGPTADLFDCAVPATPKSKALPGSEAETRRLRALWPAGEQAAHERLAKFCDGDGKDSAVRGYHERRNMPADDTGTSRLSVHFASGTLSARTAVRHARDRNSTKTLNGGVEGIKVWISEVAWRDFYRHVLAHWPYVCMHKPYKVNMSNLAWSYDMKLFEAWRMGRTGFPLVDAAMRQAAATGWMHNRCRMVVASFLCKDLLLDWRMGERWFMENLVDGDFASNSGGWGFGSSVGVDPQPYFRIFNPILQSEKFDPSGEYIRRWVPELEGLAEAGKAVHEPYARGWAAEAKEAGYPKPVVVHAEARAKALDMYNALR